jgi:DNA-binding NarL/FixJ family response regulator
MAGAAGYLLKDTEAEKLIEGIEVIAYGGSLLDPAVTQTVLSWMQQPSVQVPGDPLCRSCPIGSACRGCGLHGATKVTAAD